MTPEVPKTHYATSGGTHLAYQVLGEGPLDVLHIAGPRTPIDLIWDDPLAARALRRLASFSRMILCDLRGCGSSDSFSIDTMPAMQAWADDIGAVLDAVDSESSILFAASEPGLPTMMFAASHPERVSGLVLVNPYARLVRSDEYPWGLPSSKLGAYVDAYTDQFGQLGGLDVLAPSRAEDQTFRYWLARSQRLGLGPNDARAMFTVYASTDLTPFVSAIRSPTLIVQREDDRHVRRGHAEFLVETIPNARLVTMPGHDNVWFAGDVDALIDEIELFATGRRGPVDVDRVLATVLFTDLVGSTEHAARVGDRRWRDLLDSHNTIARATVEAARGRLVKFTGDGVLATFDGPARAIRCACILRDVLRPIEMVQRAALHTGEVELIDEDVGGIGVHIAARLLEFSGPDEVIVSGSVPSLVIGSGLHFVAHGNHQLRGVPGDWPIFKVDE